MDDALDSSDSEEEIIRLLKQLQQLYASNGMEIRKWISNSPLFMSNCATQHLSPALELMPPELHGPEQGLKTSGVAYRVEGDNFHFTDCVDQEAKPSRRSILSVVARLYDPLGFLGLYTIVARMLFQASWLVKADRDDKLDGDIAMN